MWFSAEIDRVAVGGGDGGGLAGDYIRRRKDRGWKGDGAYQTNGHYAGKLTESEARGLFGHDDVPTLKQAIALIWSGTLQSKQPGLSDVTEPDDR